jgi:mannose-6-phosphate isomerase-like protein (cupin superfamily)
MLVPSRVGSEKTSGYGKPAMSTDYVINLDVKYQPLELIDIPALVETVTDPWFNQTLTQVNGCVVRLGIFLGEFHWHKHDEEDELFYVLDGRLQIDLENRTIDLSPKQAFMIPKGVVHRTLAREKTVVLMIEGAGVVPTGD